MNEDTDDLIAEAREHFERAGRPNINDGQGYCGRCSGNWPCLTVLLADALEAATRERDAALADKTYWHEVATKAKDQRDAALAAIERVRARASGLTGHSTLPAARMVAREVLAALDGAPEPEGRWEYRARTDYGRVVAQGSLDEIGHLSGHIWERRRKAGPWLPVEGESK